LAHYHELPSGDAALQERAAVNWLVSRGCRPILAITDQANALARSLYDSVFKTASISVELAQELRMRDQAKIAAGHVSRPPE
jgi:hypothetical protein